jgi:hypothetical protein
MFNRKEYVHTSSNINAILYSIPVQKYSVNIYQYCEKSNNACLPCSTNKMQVNFNRNTQRYTTVYFLCVYCRRRNKKRLESIVLRYKACIQFYEIYIAPVKLLFNLSFTMQNSHKSYTTVSFTQDCCIRRKSVNLECIVFLS